MRSLVESVREKGVLQPILVRRDPVRPEMYEIIAGERRWRAAQQAQLHEIPVLLRELSDQEAAEVALIENIQRENLSPIEEAEGYRRLIERSEEHTSELQSLMRISYAVFCLKQQHIHYKTRKILI